MGTSGAICKTLGSSRRCCFLSKNHTCRYLYDVTQTGGKELPEMWTLTDRNTPELLNTLNNRYNINAGSVKECIEHDSKQY
mgnify:CR=1 FL=1